MSASIRDYNVLIYWALYYVVAFLPFVLYRDFRKYERYEMLESFPQQRRLIVLLPRINAAGSLLVLFVILLVWMDTGTAREMMVHLIGMAYGGLLLLDAGLAWYSGFRSIGGFRQYRYAVDQGRTWRMQLQFAVSLVYFCTAVLLLLRGVG